MRPPYQMAEGGEGGEGSVGSEGGQGGEGSVGSEEVLSRAFGITPAGGQ